MASQPDLKDEIVRMLHPKWHLVRAHYLVTECRLSYEEAGVILGHCAGRQWIGGKPYHPNTVREYVRRGRIEVVYFKGPLWKLSRFARSYLDRREGINLADDEALDQVRKFVSMYSEHSLPPGCGPKIWKDIVDAVT